MRGLQRQRERRMLAKLILLIVGLVLLLVIGISAVKHTRRVQPEGSGITIEEVLCLTWALEEGLRDAAQMEPVRRLEAEVTDPEAPLTYEQFQVIAGALAVPAAVPETDTYSKKYKREFLFLAKDWEAYFTKARDQYDTGGKIRQREGMITGIGSQAADVRGEALAEERLLLEEGDKTVPYGYRAAAVAACQYQEAYFWEKDGILLARSFAGDGGQALIRQEAKLPNVWLVEVEEDRLRYFRQGYVVTVPWQETDASVREQVADLEFSAGQLRQVTPKMEKVTGKLLAVNDGGIELEGAGRYAFAGETLPVYRLYGGLMQLPLADLCIGYDFTDFVLENGQIVAALVVKDEAMEKIRVLLKTSDYGAIFHDSLQLSCDADMVLQAGQETVAIPAGRQLELAPDSDYFAASDWLVLKPAALTARTSLLNVHRSQGTPSYRGSLEIKKTADGLLVINELLLEEYLYAVVPSEMPAAYPKEALKAQAICARTYAYKRMRQAGLAQYGAHVDDSTSYQVYNNIIENSSTTQAVQETRGQVLSFGEELADTYYYSTSCGFGTDPGVWGNENEVPYLASRHINAAEFSAAAMAAGGKNEGKEAKTGETAAEGQAVADPDIEPDQSPLSLKMEQEEAFRQYITRGWPEDYEKEEPWYRWNYEVKRIDEDVMLKSLQGRYQAGKNNVLTRQKDGSYSSQPVERLGKIKSIEVEHRNAGGAVDRLLIRGEKASYQVRTELAVRYVLFDGSVPLIRQDGSEAGGLSMLPSAYFSISASQRDGSVVGYELSGGGFGHGIGMSQNGAKNMAQAGVTGSGILSFFYQGCKVTQIY